MGFSIKELTYNNKHILYSSKEELAGPWVSFKVKEKGLEPVLIILKNIEPTPVYQLINTRTGKGIDRITLDFDLGEYFKKHSKNKIKNLITKIIEENQVLRLYIDVFHEPNLPYLNTYFTFKNQSNYNFYDFNIYFIFDFDINGLDGFDNDFSNYDNASDTIFQYDSSGLYAGFSLISKSTYFESSLTKDFAINKEKTQLSNKLHNSPGEILSALQIEFKTLKPNKSFQTALTISGGDNKKELFENISNGKKKAINYLKQVNRNIKSKQRNIPEESLQKLNKLRARNCSK
ncbi:MAG: hypothetical protein JXA99_04785 [Candidatus Lokiarchaeota archaeon]|nr:hypothetical protein [Candidatus Lokiarchaeota archaeon]